MSLAIYNDLAKKKAYDTYSLPSISTYFIALKEKHFLKIDLGDTIKPRKVSLFIP